MKNERPPNSGGAVRRVAYPLQSNATMPLHPRHKPALALHSTRQWQHPDMGHRHYTGHSGSRATSTIYDRHYFHLMAVPPTYSPLQNLVRQRSMVQQVN